MKKLNLIGQKFGRLTVLESAPPISGRTAWKCECICGKTSIVKTGDLRDGSTKSCGCLNNDQRSARAKNMLSKVIKYTPKEASARVVYGNYVKRENDKSTMLTFSEFFVLSQQNCFYCGAQPSNVYNVGNEKNRSVTAKNEGEFRYNGLDRVDNTLPHTKENCVACCFACNYAKRDRTLAEFKAWIIKLYTNVVGGNS